MHKMHKRKTFLFLALAALILLACSLTNGATMSGAAVLKTPAERPQRADQPETIATPTPSPERCIVDTGTAGGLLNMRSCAGTNCGVILVLDEGARLDVIDTADGWQEVQTQHGRGWINSNYCKKTE